jgi:hypothetical protein
MEITGSIADQSTGAPIPNVTIWELMPDGQSANVVGASDSSGKYDVELDNPASNVNYAVDGYTALSIPATQAANSDQVLLAKDGSITATLKLSNVPAWLWLLAGVTVVWLIGDDKKKK